MFGQSKFGGLDAVNGNVELRQVVRLLHAHVHRAGNCFDLIRQPHGERAVFDLVGADDLHVKRRGQAEVERLAHNVRRQKINHHAGKFAAQPRAQPPHIIRRGRVAGLERNQNVRVARADDAAGVVAQIDRGIGNADVVENAAKFARRNFTVDDAVDLAGETFGFLDARAGGRAQVQ